MIIQDIKILTFAAEIPFAIHVLNGTFEKINYCFDHYGEGSLSNVESMKKFLKEPDLEKRCRDYLVNLPNKVNIENSNYLEDLAKKYKMPDFNYNTNRDIMDMLK